jgi:uncharacterized protein YoaH (UPF0181 family)
MINFNETNNEQVKFMSTIKDMGPTKEPQRPVHPEKSLNVAIEQVAQLLRHEVKATTTWKAKQRQTKILSLQALGPSMSNSIEQVAKLLRTELHKAKAMNKRDVTVFKKS